MKYTTKPNEQVGAAFRAWVQMRDVRDRMLSHPWYYQPKISEIIEITHEVSKLDQLYWATARKVHAEELKKAVSSDCAGSQDGSLTFEIADEPVIIKI